MTQLYEQMGLPSNVVYIRAISRAELPSEVLEGVDEVAPLFAVFAEDGQQIAVVDSQKIAFDLAEEHKFALHSVH
jgi:hypothetical protein